MAKSSNHHNFGMQIKTKLQGVKIYRLMILVTVLSII